MHTTKYKNKVAVDAKLSHDNEFWVYKCKLAMHAHRSDQTTTMLHGSGFNALTLVWRKTLDSSMQIIHTYVNPLRGRMDDVTDMLF